MLRALHFSFYNSELVASPATAREQIIPRNTQELRLWLRRALWRNAKGFLEKRRRGTVSARCTGPVETPRGRRSVRRAHTQTHGRRTRTDSEITTTRMTHPQSPQSTRHAPVPNGDASASSRAPSYNPASHENTSSRRRNSMTTKLRLTTLLRLALLTPRCERLWFRVPPPEWSSSHPRPLHAQPAPQI